MEETEAAQLLTTHVAAKVGEKYCVVVLIALYPGADDVDDPALTQALLSSVDASP